MAAQQWRAAAAVLAGILAVRCALGSAAGLLPVPSGVPSLRPDGATLAGRSPGGSLLAIARGAPQGRVQLRGGADAGAEGQEGHAEGYDEIPIDVLTEMGREAIGEKKYSEAANCLSAALARMVEQHGELATECAQLYYLYGSALALEAEEADDALFGPSVPSQLPLARHLPNASTTNALDAAAGGDAVSGEEEEEEDEDGTRSEGDGISDQAAEDEGEIEQEAVQSKGGEATVEPGEVEGEAGAVAESGHGENATARDDPREQAWQVLDIARVILERSTRRNATNASVALNNATKKLHLMLSDVYMRLGDLHLHSECYNASYMDYSECLALREGACASDDRSVMEAHFVSGMAKLYGGDKQAALSHFEAAALRCRQRIEREKDTRPGRESSFVQILKDIETRIEEETASSSLNISEFRESLRQRVTLAGYTAAEEAAAEELAPVPVSKAAKRQRDDAPADPARSAQAGVAADGEDAQVPSPAKKARTAVPLRGDADKLDGDNARSAAPGADVDDDLY